MSLQPTPSPPLPLWSFEPNARSEHSASDPAIWGDRIRAIGAELGFSGLGFASVEPFEDAHQVLNDWLNAGYQGTMGYMAAAPRHDPRGLAPHAQSLIVGAVDAPQREGSCAPDQARVARYARGADYHGELRQKLSLLGQAIANVCGRSVSARACVDTAPLLEREAARRAGIGFIGKSNLLIVPGLGSHVLLCALLVDVAIAADTPMEQRCGQCTRCLDACPTKAFVGPWLLDARRCISYLTIEYKGWIDIALRPLMGTHVFGCDICQDVCPYNRGKGAFPPLAAAAHDGALQPTELESWLTLTSSGYRRLTAGSALRRASRWQLLRNAAVAAGNSGDFRLVAPLARLLTSSTYAIVRGHAAWALGRLGNEEAAQSLRSALQCESEGDVLNEISAALLCATRNNEKPDTVAPR